jgi:hypothetical protein
MPNGAKALRATRSGSPRRWAAFAALEKDPAATRPAREAIRELGRIAGYVEDIVRALEHHLDGRKLAGVKRRLDRLGGTEPLRTAVRSADAQRIEHLLEAEATSGRWPMG